MTPSSEDSIEAMLGNMRPAQLPESLMTRLQASCPRPAAAPAGARVIRLLPLAAACAAVAAAAGYHQRSGLKSDAATPVPAAASDEHPVSIAVLQPQESRQKLIALRQLAIVRDARQRAVRLMHATWLDENIYGRPGGAAALHETQLREEVVPVLLTAY